MFNFLKGKKTEITVTLDRVNGIYAPGETVGVTVEVVPDKDLKLKGAKVELAGTEEFEYGTTRTSTDSDGHTTREHTTTWGSNTVCADETNFLGGTTLPAGTPQRYTFQLALPADAMPSCAADILRVKWMAHVKLDRPMASDLHTEAALTVRVPPPATPAALPSEYGVSTEPQEADLTLSLPGLEAVAGQPLSGQLRVLPHKDFAAEVRVELVRTESVYHDEGGYKQTALPFKLAGNTSFSAGQPQTFPFQIALPAETAPTMEVPHGRITWMIRGVLNRRLRKDTTVEQEFRVYQAKE